MACDPLCYKPLYRFRRYRVHIGGSSADILSQGDAIKRVVRNILLNTALLLSGTLAGLTLCELGVRAFIPQGAQTTETGLAFFLRHDPETGWVNRPGVSGEFRLFPSDRPSDVRINSMGFRGSEFRAEKTPGLKRIAVIGDSVMFGYRVNERESFPYYLEKMLNDSIQVINMGVIAYGTDQELELLEKEIAKYSPDLVVVGFNSGNDIVDVTSSVRFGVPKPFYTRDGNGLALNNVPVPEFKVKKRTLDVGFLSKLHMYRLIANRFPSVSQLEKDKSRPAMSLEEGWQVMERIVKEMKALCKKNDSRLLFVIVPDGWVLDSIKNLTTMRGEGGFRANIRAILERNDIPYLDLWPDFYEEQEKGKVLYIEGDPDHWNPEGNRLAAQITGRWLDSMGLVRKSR